MHFDPATTEAAVFYKLMTATVIPRPIAWVVSQDEQGKRNAAPFSFFNVMGDAPPVLAIGVTARPGGVLKHTARNILATGSFVVNLVPERLVAAMNLTAIDAPDGVDELELAALETAPSLKIAPPRIASSPVAFECQLLQAVKTGPAQHLFIAEILALYLSDEALRDPVRGHVDTDALGLVARSYGSQYLRSQDGFQLERPRWADQSAQDRADKARDPVQTGGRAV